MMTTSATLYPTPYIVCQLIEDHLKNTQEAVADWDEYVWDFMSDKYDHMYFENTEWFDEEDQCIKDELRDQVLEMLGRLD